ncbi:hypothetical protein D3C78_445550 [compost metagenome]
MGRVELPSAVLESRQLRGLPGPSAGWRGTDDVASALGRRTGRRVVADRNHRELNQRVQGLQRQVEPCRRVNGVFRDEGDMVIRRAGHTVTEETGPLPVIELIAQTDSVPAE